jgi:hypothetical protein
VSGNKKHFLGNMSGKFVYNLYQSLQHRSVLLLNWYLQTNLKTIVLVVVEI